jgi:hypothetical protein
MTERDRVGQQFTPSGFFVLRTPLLPFEELAAWSEGLEAVGSLGDRQGLEAALERDQARLRARLLAAVSRPEVREAVFLASPSLDEALEVWQKDPDSKQGRKLEPAVVSYFRPGCTCKPGRGTDVTVGSTRTTCGRWRRPSSATHSSARSSCMSPTPACTRQLVACAWPKPG